MITYPQLNFLLNQANKRGVEASERYLAEGGLDTMCGFAWVTLERYNGKKIDGRSKIGKMLKEVGVRKDYRGRFHVWSPAPTQSIDANEVAARVMAEIFNEAGFETFAESRLD